MEVEPMNTPHMAPMVSGDIKTHQFVVVDTDGNVVNLSAFTDIAVKAFALGDDGLPTGAAVISDNLAGDVDLVGGGTGGAFSWALVAADTAALAGDYWVEAKLTDAGGLIRHTSPAILHVAADLITA